jgi:RHS repeat-associated protein
MLCLINRAADMARQTQLCRFAYDPLDRLGSRTPLAEAVIRDFYRADRLATQLQGAEQRSFVHHDDQLLAQHNVVSTVASTVLTATDSQASVVRADNVTIAYGPYGYHAPIARLPGFNGEHPDPVTGHYLLGNGYRAYNPTLMRFNRPDSLSPFGNGGLNAYAYCTGDPVNRRDPSGHEVDTRQLFGYVWMGLGLFGAVWGVKSALPALKAMSRGAASHTQQLTARSAWSQVFASTLFTASGVVNVVDPGAEESIFLIMIATSIAIPTVPARIRANSLTNLAAKDAARAVYAEKIKQAFMKQTSLLKATADARRSSGLTANALDIRSSPRRRSI